MINDEAEQAWLAPRLYGGTWLNMKLTTPGQTPDNWLDGSRVSFVNWKEKAPFYATDKMCVRMSGTADNTFSTWENVPCDDPQAVGAYN